MLYMFDSKRYTKFAVLIFRLSIAIQAPFVRYARKVLRSHCLRFLKLVKCLWRRRKI